MESGKVLTNAEEGLLETDSTKNSSEELRHGVDKITLRKRQIKFLSILLIALISISISCNIIGTDKLPSSEQQFICVGLGYDYYPPGDWDCEQIRDDYVQSRNLMRISFISGLGAGLAAIILIVKFASNPKGE